MLILKLAFRNLMRHRRKTIVIGSLIAVGMAALFVANAVFESTNQGLRSSLIRSLTGDAALSARADTSFSLFGSEVPIVSEYESIPAMTEAGELLGLVNGLPETEASAPIVSALAQMRIGGIAVNVPVFGVEPDSYFKVCTDIAIERGDVSRLSDGGVFLNGVLAASLEASLGRQLTLGEDVVFGMYSGGSFRLKKGSFAGVHRYVSSTETLDRVVLADPTLVRSIANYTLGYAMSSDDPAPTDDTFDLDSLFGDVSDSVAEGGSGLTLESVEDALADTSERDTLVMTDAAAWSFILVKARAGDDVRLARALFEAVRDREDEYRVLSWREAAGSSAQALFAIQSAFYVGLGFVALGAVLVIMNALVISVLERSAEIGTMRGLGAGGPFIRGLFVAESMALTLSAAAIGVAAGYIVALVLAKGGIILENPLLVSLFGGNVVRPAPSLRSAGLHLVLAAFVGALAWIYPVSLAMRVQPVAAMSKA